jgi:uncharacterized protein (DUF427 family)
MPRAIWKNQVIAESDAFEEVEQNVYFPPGSIQRSHLQESDHTTECPWKGTAHYYHVVVDDQINENAAWYYPSPNPAAANIKDHVAFWHGIRVER